MQATGESDAGAKYFWRAGGYFFALAAINLVAHSELGYALAQSLPSLRRWDQKGSEGQPIVSGAVEVRLAEEGWHDLEYGVRIQFQAAGEHQPGYYWQIPARCDNGALLWPQTLDPATGEPMSHFCPRPSVHHYYALLALVTRDGEVSDCRCVFEALTTPLSRQR